MGAWLVWLFAGSSEFGECIRQRKEYHTYQALHENPIFIFALWVRFHLNSSCTAHTLNAYGGAVAALAGVIVAGFTGTLWWSTEKMWTLAQQQRLTDKRVRAEDNRRFEETLKVSKRDADAADRAVAHAISVTKMELRPWVYVHIAIGTREYRDPNNDEYASVVFEIANYGRMPASIERCVVGATTGKTPEGILRDQYHDVIAPGERKKAQDYFPGNLIYRRVFNNLDSDDESFLIPEVESGQHVLFYISIDYLGIDPSIGYKTVCCWRWDFGVNYWVQYNDPQYNYRT